MIPLQLKLENFMTYTAAELDFTSFRIACLSGSNGAGKSTILDALTWALFDQSRASDSEDLIRLGASEMRAELTFSLEGQIYRVIRSRRRKGKGKASGKAALELQLQAEEGFRSISGKKISETQQRIDQTLRMNYSLFVNSSFILQGRADAFTTATPAERKRVLADILQLDAYERMRQEAIEIRRELRIREAPLRAQIQRHEEELSARNHLEEHLKSCLDHQARIQVESDELELQRAQLEREAETLRGLDYELQHLSQQLLELSKRLEQLSLRLAELALQIEKVQRWLEHADQIEAGYLQLQACESALRALEADFSRYGSLEQRALQLQAERDRQSHALALAHQQAKHHLDSLNLAWQRLQATLSEQTQIESAHAEWSQALMLEQELYSQQSRWQALNLALSKLGHERESGHQAWHLQMRNLKQQLAQLEAELATRPALRAELDMIIAQLEQMVQSQTRLDVVQARGLELRHEQETLTQQVSRLKSVQVGLQERRERLQAHLDSVCPMCERLLTPADLELLLSKDAQESAHIDAEQLAIAPQLEQLADEILLMRKSYQEIARELKPRDALQSQRGSLEHHIAQLDQAAQRSLALKLELEMLDTAHQQAVLDLDQRQQNLESEIVALAFAPESLNQLQARIRELQWCEQSLRELQQARLAEPELQAQLNLAQTEAKQLESSAHTEALTSLSTQIQQLEDQLKQLEHVPAERRRLQTQQEACQVFAERFARLAEARIRMETLTAQQQQLNQEASDLTFEREQLQSQQAEHIASLEAGAGVRSHMQELLARIEQLNQTDKGLHAEVFSLRKELETLDQRAQELTLLQTELGQLLYEVQLYDVLEESFGKNGLQAVLIENALPEIEQIANDMLASMTEGRMHIKLQTLRSLKSRDKLAETLDILISDELGTRSYETFSAGEAFRVNFALRLAISKLLTRRAGARLQTLVIDEGFGSQDAEGKTRLIEAINAVEKDFARILVITHVDDLKALFSCRIEVVKTNGGSKLSVLHV
ncbi:MAG: hypothetical protein CVV27_10830 [Candidatus Melainabacteria bacterium HGW-Melainabacteria-1]|nr:MAG: hypothetical protein CVV27_10830 [Candidatus Melainabacteria bacterium HGW-Melainabacteria-1]